MNKKLGKPLLRIKDSYVDPAPNEDEVLALVNVWDMYAPKKFRGLLMAKNKAGLQETGNAEPSGGFLWDAANGHYVEARTGRVISRSELHNALSQFVQSYASR